MNFDFGFILSRHVSCPKTNEYWNRCVHLLNKWYPYRPIIIIDDNSKQEFVTSFHNYKNLQIIQSEFPGRGEILPYYYFYIHKFFSYAVIIHDSVFFHKRVAFEKFFKFEAIPFWNFDSDTENVGNSLRMVSQLTNGKLLMPFLIKKNASANTILGQVHASDFPILGMPTMTNQKKSYEYANWKGCFGVQSFISLSFLTRLVDKYHVFQLLKVVNCKADRCCLERIFGILFYLELTYKTISLF